MVLLHFVKVIIKKKKYVSYRGILSPTYTKKKKKSFEVFCDGDSLCVLSIKSLREKCVVLNTGV